MRQRPQRPGLRFAGIDALEGRTLLSGATATAPTSTSPAADVQFETPAMVGPTRPAATLDLSASPAQIRWLSPRAWYVMTRDAASPYGAPWQSAGSIALWAQSTLADVPWTPAGRIDLHTESLPVADITGPTSSQVVRATWRSLTSRDETMSAPLEHSLGPWSESTIVYGAPGFVRGGDRPFASPNFFSQLSLSADGGMTTIVPWLLRLSPASRAYPGPMDPMAALPVLATLDRVAIAPHHEAQPAARGPRNTEPTPPAPATTMTVAQAVEQVDPISLRIMALGRVVLAAVAPTQVVTTSVVHVTAVPTLSRNRAESPSLEPKSAGLIDAMETGDPGDVGLALEEILGHLRELGDSAETTAAAILPQLAPILSAIGAVVIYRRVRNRRFDAPAVRGWRARSTLLRGFF